MVLKARNYFHEEKKTVKLNLTVEYIEGFCP